MRRACLYCLFFLSGVSALAYELTWQRLLHLLFGVSTLAVSTVLAAYMGGLALGGLLFGRLADRTSRPLRLYACLEAALGLSALLMPAAFALLAHVYTTLHEWLSPSPEQGALLRFGLAFLVLLIPSSLLGGTLPFMARLVMCSTTGRPSAFSLLYGVNTLGAMTGAALTGLLLIRYLGTSSTIALAAGLNLLAALVATCLSLWPDSQPHETAASTLDESDADVPEQTVSWPLIVASVTGAVTTGLEVAWARVLAVFTSSSAYAFATLLLVILAGLSVGSLLQAAWSRRQGDSRLRLALCQALLALCTLGTLPWFHTAPDWLARLSIKGSSGQLFLGELGLTVAALLAPAILMGMSFPLLAAESAGKSRQLASRLGRLSASNTLGCVAGAFAAGFLLIPSLGIQATFSVLAAGALTAALIALCLARRPGPVWRSVLGAVVVLAAGAAWRQLPGSGFLKETIEAPRQLVYYREGNNGTVSIVQETDGVRHVMVDGQPVAGTGATDVVDQKMLAHLPLLLHPAPERALTVGFGSGGTSHSMSLHGVAVDCVEIEPAVPGGAKHLLSENHNILDRPNFRLILDDARSWLRVAPVNYDAIVTDCTNLQYKSNGDLYTREYFELMRHRLSSGGVAAAWVPANGIDEPDLKTLLRSFQCVFPHTSVWHMNCLPTDFLIVVGTPGPLDIDLNRLSLRMAKPGVREDLERVGLANPYRLLYTFLSAAADLDLYLGQGPINTDDRPILSYSTYGASYRSTIARNLVGLLACRGDVGQFVHQGGEAMTLLRHRVASNEALLGHVSLLSGDPCEAMRHYVAGARLLPVDPSLNRLVFGIYSQALNGSRK